MKLFGRDLAANRSEVRVIYKYLWYFIRCFLMVKSPFSFIRCYLAQSCPTGNRVYFRNGMKILLSGHPHDVVTVFVVFVRQDYGKVRPGDVVLDIGANLGIFSVYAASRGARLVHAFEPNSASHELMVANIRENGLERTIMPHRAAVCGRNLGQVRFPKGSSMYHAIIRESHADEADGDYECVPSVSLNTIIEEHFGHGSEIDILKLDCEGSEYDILFSTSHRVYGRIRDIRLEYHEGRAAEILSFLEERGYRKRRLMRESAFGGTMWLERAGAFRGL